MSNDKKIVLHPVTNEEHNSFVGIRIRNDEIHLHYPESYEIASKDDKKAFRRYKTRVRYGCVGFKGKNFQTPSM